MPDSKTDLTVLASSELYMRLYETNLLEIKSRNPKVYRSCAIRLNMAVEDSTIFPLLLLRTVIDPECDILEAFELGQMITSDRMANCPDLSLLVERLTRV